MEVRGRNNSFDSDYGCTGRLSPSTIVSCRARTIGSRSGQRVPIRWTPCRLGGERPWFVCNVSANGAYCGRLVAKLHGAGRLLRCNAVGQWIALIIVWGACTAS
jgi:hypothetical protein